LEPAVYTITVKTAGFNAATRQNVEVRVNDRLRVDFSLRVGAVTQTVEVKGSAPLLQTEGATAGEVIDNQRTTELPLNGRNWLQLATLAPATVPYPMPSGYLPQSFTANLGGSVTSQQNYVLNGMDMTCYIGCSGPVAAPPIDSIQEFKVETNNYAADSGRLGGAVLNATIKSGSNAFHGTAYDFLRNNVLNARNLFAETGPKPEFTRNQFGGSLGGPIKRNKLFFFLNYEGYRQRQNTINTTQVYTDDQKNGNFSSELGSEIGVDALGRPVDNGQIFDPFSVRQVTEGVVDPVTGLTATQTTFIRDPYPMNQVSNINSVAQTLIKLVPPANRSGAPNYVVNESNPLNIDTLVGRVDWTKSDHDTLQSYFLFTDAANHTAPILPLPADGGSYTDSIDNQRMWGLGWTHIFRPTDLNEFRVAYVRNSVRNSNPQLNEDLNAKYGIPFAFPGMGAGGMTGFDINGYTHIGTADYAPFFEYIYKDEISDTYTAIRGPHQLKFGFLWMHQNLYNQLNCDWCRGAEQFTGLFTQQVGFPSTGDPVADFLTGAVTSAQDGTLTNEKDVGHDIEWFAQDMWHARRKLNITAGVRYQYNPPSWEYRDNMSSVTFGANFSNPQVVVPSGMSDTNYNLMKNVWFPDIPVVRANNLSRGLTYTYYANFAPRLGIAYQISPSTVLRTGYGVFYGFNEVVGASVLTINPPSKLLIGLNSDTIHPTYLIDQPVFGANPFDRALINPFFYSIRNPNLEPEFTQMWNLTIQHQFQFNWLLEVGYLGNRTTDNYVNNNINDARPVPPSDTSDPQTRRYVSTVLGNLPELTPEGYSNYHALYISGEKRFSQGMSLMANYTWSRALGIGQDIVSGFNTTSFLDPLNLRREYGPLEFDVINHASIAYIYELPFGRGKRFLSGGSGAANQVLGGWQINGIATLQGGFPLTPTLGYSPGKTFTNGRPDFLGNPYASAHTPDQWLNPNAFAVPSDAEVAAGNYFGNCGVGVVREPGTVNLDFSMFKSFPIREGMSLQFRSEFFNVTNTPPLGLPWSINNFFPSPSFGTVGYAGDPRVIQFALKLIF
jgi:hypothetical protein